MPKKKAVVDPMGQWKYPGDVTIIPSNSITMQGVNYPVLGVDDLGNAQMMMPGGQYTFPGNYVTEFPQMQLGGMSKRKVDKYLQSNKDLNWVKRLYQPNTPTMYLPGSSVPSTHYMESADGRVYPTIVQRTPDSPLEYLGDDAYDYAMQSGEYIQFPNDRQARRFAESYKKGTDVLKEFGKGGLTQWFAEEWTDIKTGKPCGRQKGEKRAYPACRPKKRVNETTPKTTSEMSSSEKAKFKRVKNSGERISYNHKRREFGGEMGWLDQYQSGGSIRPTYQDSLDLYNFTQLQKRLEQPSDLYKPSFMEEMFLGSPSKLTPQGKKDQDLLRQEATRLLKTNPNLKSGLYYTPPGIKKSTLSDYIEAEGSYDIYHPGIKPQSAWIGIAPNNDYSNVKPKPILKPALPVSTASSLTSSSTSSSTSSNPEIAAKQQKLIDAGYNIGEADGIWGPKSQAAWDAMNASQSTTTAILPTSTTSSSASGGYRAPIIQQFQYMSPENKEKALRKYGSVSNIPFKGVDINQLKNGGWLNNYQDGGSTDSTLENIVEFFDPTGVTSWDDAYRAYNQWKKSGSSLPSMDQTIDMFGAVPSLGKLGKLKYLDAEAIKQAYKYFDWQKLINQYDAIQDELSSQKCGGQTRRLNNYQDGGETSTEQSPDRIAPIEISAKRDPWYKRLPRQVADRMGFYPYGYDTNPNDFSSQMARRIGSADSPAGAFFGALTAPLATPQLGAMYAMTGEAQTPSEYYNVQNPYAAFALNALTDPLTYVGTGAFTNIPSKISNTISRQIYKNPKLGVNLATGLRLPIKNIDNITVSPGLKPGDIELSSFLSPAKGVSEQQFIERLASGAQSLDQSLQKRISDLKSPEGFKRLVNQEKEYYLSKGEIPSVADDLANLSAKARINELENTYSWNTAAKDYGETNVFAGKSELSDFSKDELLLNNAYYRQTSPNSGSTFSPYYKSDPGSIGIGYNVVGDKPIEMHEIAHALQRGRVLPIDDELRQLTPKKNLPSNTQRAYDYFSSGTGGREASAFANELRESMFQKGFIPDYYSPISQQQVQNAYGYFKTNPMGVYDPNNARYLSNTRIFDFMAPTKANSKLLTDILNKLPAAIPVAAGASQLRQQKNGGWLNKYN